MYRSGADLSANVLGLTHLSVHISPLNDHHGIDSAYRNCGSTAGRSDAVDDACESAAEGEFDYTTWNHSDTDVGRPTARATFNPDFDQMIEDLTDFLGSTH